MTQSRITPQTYIKYRELLDIFSASCFAEFSGQVLMGRVTVTPAMMQAVMDGGHIPVKEDGNPRNRKRLQRNMIKITNDLNEGRFFFTGQPMIYDEHSMEVDGQHRRLAILETGKEMDCAITIGVPSSTFKCVDQGASRNASTIVQLAGYEYSRELAAAARVFLIFKNCGHFDNSCEVGALGHHAALLKIGGNSHLLECVQSYPGLDPITRTLCARKHTKDMLRFIAAWTAMLYVFRRIDPDLCSRFISALVMKDEDIPMMDMALRPVLQLRDRLSNKTLSQAQVTALGIKAWNKVRTGDTGGQQLVWKEKEYPKINGLSYTSEGIPVGRALTPELEVQLPPLQPA